MGDNQCAACGQWAGKGHRCPASAPSAPAGRRFIPERPSRSRTSLNVDLTDRVARAQAILANRPTNPVNDQRTHVAALYNEDTMAAQQSTEHTTRMLRDLARDGVVPPTHHHELAAATNALEQTTRNLAQANMTQPVASANYREQLRDYYHQTYLLGYRLAALHPEGSPEDQRCIALASSARMHLELLEQRHYKIRVAESALSTLEGASRG